MTTWDKTREQLRAEVIAWSPPPPLALALALTIDKTNRSRAVSNLQKAVRFGQQHMAAETATGLVRLGEWYLFRRLTVIACEDIGPGDVETVAAVLLGSFDMALRSEVGSERLAAFLASKMAGAVKCTTSCDLWRVGELPDLKAKVGDMRRALPDDLVGLMSDPSMPWQDRACALRALRMIGTDADKKTDWTHFNQALDKMDLSPVERLAVDLSKSPAIAQEMGEFLALAIDLTRIVPPTVETGTPDLTVDGMLSAAMDQHCGEGKRSLGYLAKASDPIRSFSEERPQAQRFTALGEAIFIVEGRQTDRRLRSWLLDEVDEAGQWSVIQPTGLSAADYAALKLLVRQEMPVLHHARRRVLQRMTQEAATESPQKVLPL